VNLTLLFTNSVLYTCFCTVLRHNICIYWNKFSMFKKINFFGNVVVCKIMLIIYYEVVFCIM
jgi:hypothetical protein